jgi:uncharacterized membrane protein
MQKHVYGRAILIRILFLTFIVGAMPSRRAFAAHDGIIQVLYVGGDWKSQLTNYQQKTPLRGHFVQSIVSAAAPGRFNFTFWTSYEFLQYGDEQSLAPYDVIVVGDVMGESVLPRLANGLATFVKQGGGLWYCDNHKAFSFVTRERSFDSVLPIEMIPFRPYDENGQQPMLPGPVSVVAGDAHPILKGLDLTSAPPLRGARYGSVKPGATVLAKAGSGEPIWVCADEGAGRSLWTGGVFANDELSADFSKWPQFGTFCAQAIEWLAAHSTAAHPKPISMEADGTVTLDFSKTGPSLSAKHFGVHGQEVDAGAGPINDKELALYEALNPDGMFVRTSAFTGIKRTTDSLHFMNDGTDLSHFDPSKYDFSSAAGVLADIARLKAEPIFLYWLPWGMLPQLPDPATYTKYFAASIEHVNGPPGEGYVPRLKYFEIMNEPALGPTKNPPRTHEQVVSAYADFFNYAAEHLSAKYPGLKFGCGGFHEWPYLQDIMDRCGKNLSWMSRHPYGQTGEAIFYLQDQYLQHAREIGIPGIQFIITEWDFWIYGEPAFDYIMQRWKPMADHADTTLGTMQYRWREYQEGGYVFGIMGQFDQRYGELPPEWPNPGRDKPITYRYDAFWAMRNCRGPQVRASLDVPALASSPSTHAYAIATESNGKLNLVIYFGYPYVNPKTASRVDALRLHIHLDLPSDVTGRSMIVSRADARDITSNSPVSVKGDVLDTTIEVPALSAVCIELR